MIRRPLSSPLFPSPTPFRTRHFGLDAVVAVGQGLRLRRRHVHRPRPARHRRRIGVLDHVRTVDDRDRPHLPVHRLPAALPLPSRLPPLTMTPPAAALLLLMLSPATRPLIPISPPAPPPPSAS